MNNVVNHAFMAKKTYMKYFCAVLMIIGTSAHAWATHPGGNYTLVTSASDLHNGDAVILYDDVNNVGVVGTSGTSATVSSSSDDWIEYTVSKPTGSTVVLEDWSLLSGPKIYADEDGNMYKFTYSTSSGTSFTINSSGHLVCSTTRLAHYGEYVRFYGSSGTPLKVYKVGSPKVYGEECDGNLCINPDVINMAGEYNGTEDALLESGLFTVSTTYSGKQHYVYVEYDDDELAIDIYDYDYDEKFGSNGYYTAGSGEDISRLKIVCYASAAGTYSATLHVYAYNYDGAGNYKLVSIPVKITVLEAEQECTARTLSFANGTSDKTIYKADGTTYTNAATPSAGAGYGTVTYSVTSSSPAGCATVNGSGVVSFSNYGSATITASLGANGDYCAAADVSYTVSMECKSRTLTFASSTPSVSVTTDTYTQTATKSAGSGTISYAMVQSVGSGFTIDSETGEVTFNGNAGTATITASITEDASGGYCTAEGSYTLTVTPVVPTVSNFSYTSGETSMTLNGSAVTNNGGTAISAYGYIYSTTASAVGTLVLGGEGVTTAQVAAADIAEETAFAEKSITSLSEGTTYYVRAYATNSAGTGYSEIQSVRTVTYSNFVFSCAELTLEAHLVTANTPIFITSTAEKTVRSQDSILIVGNGLTPSQALEFPDLPSKFTIKSRANGALSTKADGTIDTVAYIFYTPGSGDTDDGLDKLTGISVKVGGAKPKQASLTQSIIGRHIATDFVIAAKKNGKWWALPSNMTTGTPDPAEIAVDDYNNPSVAYTATTNIYSLYDQSEGRAVKLAMRGQSDAPLFGSSGSGTGIGKSSATIVTNPQSEDYLWLFTQTNTSITNPQDAKYIMTCENSNTKSVSLKDNPVQWGLYSGGTEELRLIPASDIPFTEASVVEWGQHGAIIEVDATNPSINATSVVAHLNGVESAAITLVQTKANDAKNKSSKYNYTVNFGDAIDFADAASNGAMLTLEWKNGETVKAMSNVVVPKIIAASATMKSIIANDDPWSKAEVHVLPGVTLEANAGDFSSKDVVINQLEIYPGATVKVTKGAQDVGTLKVKTLVLRNGWTRVGSKNYDVARLYVATDANLAQNAGGDVWYSDWYIDYDQYYPIAVPFPVAKSSIAYKNTNSEASAGVKLRYYSGELRATNIQQNQDANWVEYTWGEGGTMPANLEPSHGYIMTARRPTGKAFSIVRMPMTFSNDWTALGEQGAVGGTHKDTIYVKAWGNESTPWYAKGWNIIANPYMALHEGALSYYDESGDVIEYANIPDIDFKEYSQLPIATTKLNPSSAFLVQAPKDGFVTFGATNRKADAPSFRREVQDEVLPTQKAYIVLASDEAEDMMGLLVSDKYSAEFEINADLEKLLGDGSSLRTYMHFNEMKMAYLAIDPELAAQLIPVSVRITNAGEHVFSMHSASKVGELEGIYLTDYLTGDVTNLLEDSYPFSSEAGTISGRFAINAKVGERQTPTDLDIVDGDIHGNQPVKFIYHDKVYIWHNGVIYDATGKKVREINK